MQHQSLPVDEYKQVHVTFPVWWTREENAHLENSGGRKWETRFFPSQHSVYHSLSLNYYQTGNSYHLDITVALNNQKQRAQLVSLFKGACVNSCSTEICISTKSHQINAYKSIFRTINDFTPTGLTEDQFLNAVYDHQEIVTPAARRVPWGSDSIIFYPCVQEITIATKLEMGKRDRFKEKEPCLSTPLIEVAPLKKNPKEDKQKFSAPNKPITSTSLMFLIIFSIEGVLFDRGIQSRNGQFAYMKKNFKKYGYSEPNYSSAALSQVMVDLCSKAAIGNLDLLIEQLESEGNSVGIVLFGSWLYDASTDGLREIFKQYVFSKKIIGRVDDTIYLYDKGEPIYCSLCDQGEKIDVWLQTRKKDFVIDDYLILTDVDESIPRLFKNKFIKCPVIFGKTELNAARLQLEKRKRLSLDKDHFRTAEIFNKLSIKSISCINGEDKELKFSNISLRVNSQVRHYAVTKFANATLTANQTEPLLLKWTKGFVDRDIDKIIADYDCDETSQSTYSKGALLKQHDEPIAPSEVAPDPEKLSANTAEDYLMINTNKDEPTAEVVPQKFCLVM